MQWQYWRTTKLGFFSSASLPRQAERTGRKDGSASVDGRLGPWQFDGDTPIESKLVLIAESVVKADLDEACCQEAVGSFQMADVQATDFFN